MHLWIELGLAALFVPVAALIHGLGLAIMSKLLNLSDEALEERTLDPSSFYLIGVLGLALFMVHATVVAAYAGFYGAVGAARSAEDALFFSISSYTTAGAGVDRIPDAWKLVGGSEALVGLLLVGWSTAYLVRKIEKLRN
jgi:hypothetical protein